MGLRQELKEAYEEAGVTADQIAKLEEIFTDEQILEKLTGQVMKAKDYTTKTQQLAEERRKLEKEQQEWNQGRDYMDQQTNAWKADVEKRLNSALDQVSQSRLYGAALESKLQSVAAEYGLEYEDLVKDIKDRRAAEPPKSQEPDYKPYDERYVTRDDFRGAADQMFGFAPQIRDFEREYARTFGKEYDGSITELIADASREVAARGQRGQRVDLWSVMREKLDFAGQKVRNDEAAKAAAQKEREDWEKKRSEEIERDLRTKFAVDNPALMRQPEKSEEWRNNLSAAKRQEAKQPERKATPQDNFRRQQEIHRAYEERAAKQQAA